MSVQDKQNRSLRGAKEKIPPSEICSCNKSTVVNQQDCFGHGASSAD